VFSGLCKCNHFCSITPWTIGTVASVSISQLVLSLSSSVSSMVLKYKELIEEILHFDVFDQICFEYVKGHSNNEKNDIVDNMSKKARK
jgi:large-conductance mechanosensitive channel